MLLKFSTDSVHRISMSSLITVPVLSLLFILSDKNIAHSLVYKYLPLVCLEKYILLKELVTSRI